MEHLADVTLIVVIGAGCGLLFGSIAAILLMAVGISIKAVRSR